MIYFGSDWHLDHANVIKFDKRPFDNIEEMNTAIIKNYNSIVKPEDTFYFLGDFSFAKKKERIEYQLSQLKGNKFFIKGNHDHRDVIEMYKKYGTYLGGMSEIKVNGQTIVLNHYAMRVWNKSHHGSYHLYGHSHGSLPEDPHSLSFDVGVNCNNYMPISFEEVERRMKSKNYLPVDHHGQRDFEKH